MMNWTRMMTDKGGKRGQLWMALWRSSLSNFTAVENEVSHGQDDLEGEGHFVAGL